MKVLVLHSELGVLRGGGENFTRTLFRAIAARGHDVTAAFVATVNAEYPIPLPSGIKPLPICGWWRRNLGARTFHAVAHLPLGNGHLRKASQRVEEGMSWRVIRWHNRRFQRAVARQLFPRLHEFDCVYVHGDVDLAAQVALHRVTCLRLPGPVSDDRVDALKQVQIVCANGDALARVRAFDAREVMELPVGIDEELFHPGVSLLRRRLGWSPGDVVIGYVGRLTRVKGVDLLATAFRTLSRAIGDLRLLIVGSGEAERSIRTVLTDEIAANRVWIQPDVRHEELPGWYRAMDLFVMPSRYENYSNAVLESMACGVPLVASDVGGNTSLAQDGGGWLFERESASSLASRIASVLAQDRVALSHHGEAARQYVRGRYSWALTAKLLEERLLIQLRRQGEGGDQFRHLTVSTEAT